MTYGFKALNDYGAIQIDDTYTNLTLKQKGTATTTGSYSSGSLRFPILILDLTYTPIVAFQPPVGQLLFINGLSSSDLGGGTTRYIFQFVGWGDFTFNYFVFGPPPTPTESPLPGYGLVVKDSNNVITYRSDQKYLNIAGLINSSSPTTGTTSDTYTSSTMTSGRSYAIVGSLNASYASYVVDAYPIFVTQYQYMGYFSLSSSNVIVGGWRFTGSTNVSRGTPSQYNTLQGLIIDVTNF